jgi:hypothetical protein
MKEISRLEKISLRVIWPNEAKDFTTWLANNLDVLSETLGFDLSLVEREASAGHFSADILAEDPSGNLVIIENQLQKTDHDHLGKVITYLSNLGAKTAIWISSDARPEHENAINFLNEALPADVSLYLIQLEAFRIDESVPAPNFTIVAGPSAETKELGSQKKQMAERHVLRIEFWRQLLEKARKKTSLHANISPGKENYICTGAGMSGVLFSYVIRMNDAQVELYIDCGNVEDNKRIFDQLYAKKEKIESDFGGSLDWQRLDDRRASRIRYLVEKGGLLNKDRWLEIQDALIETMIRFAKALKAELKQIKG